MKKSTNNYKNKIIVITGASGQIGRFAVKLFLNLGCLVYGLDIKKNAIKSKNFIFKKIDISDANQTAKLFNMIFKKYGKIDILINNAAISYKTPLSKRINLEIQNTFKVNLMSIINITKILATKHKRSNHCKIINIGSVYGVRSPDFKIYKNNKNINSEIYGATKAGVIQLTKYYAVALAHKNIIVNCISPGGLENPKVQNKDFKKKYNNKVPLGRMANENDLKTAFLYFSDQDTKYTTGQNLVIDGGFTLC